MRTKLDIYVFIHKPEVFKHIVFTENKVGHVIVNFRTKYLSRLHLCQSFYTSLVYIVNSFIHFYTLVLFVEI